MFSFKNLKKFGSKLVSFFLPFSLLSSMFFSFNVSAVDVASATLAIQQTSVAGGIIQDNFISLFVGFLIGAIIISMIRNRGQA